jgi:required for meiotic nuclear division protein 1
MQDAPRPRTSEIAAALPVRAVLLGERLGRTGLEAEGAITTAPLSFRVGDCGFVVVFRYGAVVMFGLSEAEEARILIELASRVVRAEETLDEEETTQILVRPDEEERITPSGAIQLRSTSPEHLLVVADAMAKSIALARDEQHVATVFDAIEPFAAGLASKGRPPGGRKAMLQMIGRALLVQHRLSGRIAVREKPDILWERPDLERLYGRLEDEYELVERAETLDRKLVFISTTASAFVDLKDADRSLRLEVTIVILIVAELVLAFVQLVGLRL